ncbi:hypothetical protein HNV08_09315 [Winogradskyella eckloniae]|uniref:hypothetical protein n=1 Tax=Winogradskyella eckloniae TaxID=1089306 RepID=UPI0015675AD9|nr:hypothetical protein [Winogradskyella eckloniae]NRD20246.1 hypothetical protein [Winogradskyella eckloniae]
MHPKTELKRLSEKYNGKFTFEDSSVAGENMSNDFYSIYNLTLNHNNLNLHIVYNYGLSDTAEFKVEMSNHKNIPEFEIKTISHLSKLLLFKNRNWFVKSSDVLFKSHISNLITSLNLDDLIKNSAFELNTIGKRSHNTYTIHTVFSLKFYKHTESAASIIKFHLEVMDVILKYSTH